jgi:IS5 family transposase
MLLQVFYSIRLEPLLMEQAQYNLLFRWFIGLYMDDTVCVPTVFSKNRERLFERKSVIELLNEVLVIASKNGWLTGEHFSVDGTLILAWAGHKSFVRKDGSDGGTGNYKGKSRNNDAHESTIDADARLYCKGNTASELRFMAHTLCDNRHDLIASAVVTTADGCAERETANVMIWDAKQVTDEKTPITLGADKGYDAAEFIKALADMMVLPHLAQNASNRKPAVPKHIASSIGYAISQQKRKFIELGFSWAKFIDSNRQVMVRGLKKVDQLCVLTMAAYNLSRMRTLEQIRLQTT